MASEVVTANATLRLQQLWDEWNVQRGVAANFEVPLSPEGLAMPLAQMALQSVAELRPHAASLDVLQLNNFPCSQAMLNASVPVVLNALLQVCPRLTRLDLSESTLPVGALYVSHWQLVLVVFTFSLPRSLLVGHSLF